MVAMCANAITWYMSRAEVAQAGIGCVLQTIALHWGTRVKSLIQFLLNRPAIAYAVFSFVYFWKAILIFFSNSRSVSTVVGSRLLLQIKRIGRHPPVVTDGSRRISMSLTMTELCPIAFDIKSEVTTFATESTAVSTHGHPRVAERDIV